MWSVLHLTLIVLALAAPAPLSQSTGGTQDATPVAVARAHASMQEGSSCIPCHRALTERPVTHAVVAAESCGECHVPPAGGKGKVGLLRDATRDNTAPLCGTCHEEILKRVGLSSPHPPAAAGDCLGCHDPHGSAAPALLNAQAPDLCVGCHEEVGEAVKRSSPHAPAAAGCSTCHDPHGSARAAQLKDGVNSLCLGCHGAGDGRETSSPSRSAAAAAPAGRPEGFASPVSLDPLGRTGHPRAGHPVSGGTNPADKKKGPLTCASCHEPHGAGTSTLLKFGVAGPMELCLKCHP